MLGHSKRGLASKKVNAGLNEDLSGTGVLMQPLANPSGAYGMP